MILSQFKDKMVASIVPLACLAFIVYLGYHSLYGTNGVLRYFQLQQKKEQLQYELSLVQNERQLLERRVHNLRDEPLDTDLLGEQARKVLGYAREDELILHRPLTDLPSDIE